MLRLPAQTVMDQSGNEVTSQSVKKAVLHGKADVAQSG